MANKNFNIDEAHRLRLIYKKERHPAKRKVSRGTHKLAVFLWN